MTWFWALRGLPALDFCSKTGKPRNLVAECATFIGVWIRPVVVVVLLAVSLTKTLSFILTSVAVDENPTVDLIVEVGGGQDSYGWRTRSW
jgi:hypothetical protein